MRIKQREHKEIFDIKGNLKSFFKKIFNKKVWIVSKVFFIIIIFLFGALTGLFATGFFGTLDNPSQVTIDVLHLMGFKSLAGTKNSIENTVKSIALENVKIPFNYISGKFSDKEKIFINIKFEDYEKLKFKREQALERGILVATDDDYIPATIRYGDKEVEVWIRLKGDLSSHYDGDKWSLRVKVRKGETLFGMQTFSIQDPKTREYLNELIYQEALKREGVLSVGQKFIDVTINGKHMGLYNLEGHFDKYLIESNNRTEGPIIRFDEGVYWDEVLQEKAYFPDALYITSNFYPSSSIDSFKTTQILSDPVQLEQFNKAKNLLESFRRGELKAHEVFDVDLSAKYFAIGTIFGAQHASYFRNIRFYYNPVTSRLEPIGYDGSLGEYDGEGYLLNQLAKSIETSNFPYEDTIYTPNLEDVYAEFFSDPVFYEKYVEELERVSKTSYLDELFNDLDEEIKKDTQMIHGEKPTYHFFKEFFYNNQKYAQRILDPTKGVNAYYAGEDSQKRVLKITIGNIYSLPMEIIDVSFNETKFNFQQEKIILQGKKPDEIVNYNAFEIKIPDNFEWKDEFKQSLKVNYKILGSEIIRSEEVIPWSELDEDFLKTDFIRQKPSLESSEFLEVNNLTKSVYLKKGSWILNKSLIIPGGYTFFIREGTEIDLVNEALILSYSKVQFIGTDKNPVRIFSSDKTGQGLVILNAKENSYFENVYFENLTYPSKEGWVLTGAITFYNSPFKFDKVIVSGMDFGDDSVNAKNSKFEIKNSLFKNCFSDCFDNDFSEGIVENSIFINSGGDGLDISGAKVEIQNVSVINPRDKGISVGEKSSVTILNTQIKGGFIGVASKDQSEVKIENLDLSECIYGLVAYQKKPEFGPSSIIATKVLFNSVKNEYLIEKNSELSLNDKIILDNKKNVYEILYPGEN